MVAMLPKVHPHVMPSHVRVDIGRVFARGTAQNPDNLIYTRRLEGDSLQILANHVASSREFAAGGETNNAVRLASIQGGR
jgi:hypothetical protein